MIAPEIALRDHIRSRILFRVEAQQIRKHVVCVVDVYGARHGFGEIRNVGSNLNHFLTSLPKYNLCYALHASGSVAARSAEWGHMAEEQRLRLKASDAADVRALADEFIARAEAAGITLATLYALADALLVASQRGADSRTFRTEDFCRVLTAVRRDYFCSRREPDLTPKQERLLAAISRHKEPVSGGWLVHETGLSRGTVNALAEILVERGAITKQVVLKQGYYTFVRAR